YEYFHRKPNIIFDSAHNTEGVYNFLDEFSKETGLYSKKSLLFGAMRDKAIGEMLKLLSKSFEQIFITEINYERAASLEEINKECESLNISSSPVRDPAGFVLEFKERSKDECLVVLGSMYLLGEIKAAYVN
ncbi:MAG: hypothetical protein WBQ32_02560, partial [Ignavibacteriaceae bacterium]